MVSYSYIAALRALFFVFWFLLYFSLAIYGGEFLPEKYFWDSQLIMDMVAGYESYEMDEGSYYYTVKIFDFFGVHLTYFLNFILGILFIFFVASFVSSLSSFMLISYLIFPHVVLGLARPQKETIVTFLTLIVMYFISIFWSRKKILWVLIIVLYLTYGIVREYYFLIILIFLLSYNVSSFDKKRILIFCAVGFLFVMAAPSEIYQMVQGTRDVFNALRPSGGVGHETIYFNPFPPVNAFNFIMNYLSAIKFFNFPILSYLSVNSLYLQLYVCIVLYLLRYGLFSGGSERFLVFLFFSHMLVLLLFEPDAGSYMRHLSSVAIYILPVIDRLRNDRAR
ncbi:hypothetical protein [Thalassolituus pacificus]|uniref:Uncharacterized protein n=1 Tax=Thalassolituus pacificus TaxID=2975440 RepID=A0A9X2WGN5_9GAMM|nr:hypothetical protein [Thalassolituus pacificus]MCT7360097.1 hypothetical protein [Thalassolituus pacificus]